MGQISGGGSMTVTSTINSQPTLEYHHKYTAELLAERKWFQVTYNFDKGRTDKQNSSLHVYCKLLADALNESGQPLIINLTDKEVEIDWTMQLVKDCIWRVIQQAITKKPSSTKLTTKETMSVYEHVNRFTASKKGISLDWPHKVDK